MAKSTTKSTTKQAGKREIKNEDHWSKRRTNPKDESKKLAPETNQIDKANIVTGTRKRSNVNYKDLQFGRPIVQKKSGGSNNVLEKRQTAKIEKTRRSRATKTATKKK